MSKSSPDFSLHTGAAGGPGLGRTREFLKESDGKDQHLGGPIKPYKDPDVGDEQYKKSGSSSPQSKRTGDKSLKAIKPRG